MEPAATSGPDETFRKRILELKKQRESLMDLAPQELQDTILSTKQPAALVHSFPEEDFYFLVHTIGPEDALPILKLASTKQWEYILDQESWQKDQIDLLRLTRWFYLLLKSDPVRFASWCSEEKTELVKFYLFRNVEVRIREHDEDPSTFGPGFMTDDDIYYVRLIDFPVVDAQAVWAKEQRNELLPELLNRISAHDHIRYQNLILEVSSILPAECEEEQYRLRNIRLAEKGFLPFDEAIGVYQALFADEIGRSGKKAMPHHSESMDLKPVPLFTNHSLKTDNLFAQTLTKIHEPEILLELQTEFATLCNQIIAADGKKVQDRSELSAIVGKAGGYLSIGLEVLKKFHHGNASNEIRFLRKYFLSEIFRIGYGQALTLKWRAQRWRRESWFQSAGLPLTFWGEAWLGVLGGLLIQKPLYYDNYQSGVLYREFATLDDIKKTDSVLEEIINFDLVLSLMEIKFPVPELKMKLSHKNLLLTLWANHHTGIMPEANHPMPIPLKDFKEFFKELWDPENPGKISDTIKAIFLDWLANHCGLAVENLSHKMGHTLTTLFDEIEMEMGAISWPHLDSRFIPLFLVQ